MDLLIEAVQIARKQVVNLMLEINGLLLMFSHLNWMEFAGMEDMSRNSFESEWLASMLLLCLQFGSKIHQWSSKNHINVVSQLLHLI